MAVTSVSADVVVRSAVDTCDVVVDCDSTEVGVSVVADVGSNG